MGTVKENAVHIGPLKYICDDGVKNLVQAIRVQASRDYITAMKYLSSHPSASRHYRESVRTAYECRYLLGDSLCDSIDRIINIRFYLTVERDQKLREIFRNGKSI